jgi:hypothetical protein
VGLAVTYAPEVTVADLWCASDGGNTWVAREGGIVPAVADAIQMAEGDTRTLVFDFGNLPEFWAGGSINLAVPPVVTVSPGNAGTPVGLLLTLTTAAAVQFSTVRQLPVVNTNAQPIGGLLLTLTQDEGEEFIGAYYVSMTAFTPVAGTYLVSVTVWLVDGTKLTRTGELIVA